MKKEDFLLICAFASLNLFDVATTQYILRHGGTEINPVAEAIIAHGWWLSYTVKVGVAPLVAYMAYLVITNKCLWRIAMIIALLLFGIVVGNNVVQIVGM